MGAPIDMDSREAALQPQGRPIGKLAKRGSENSSDPSREPREWANQPPPEINHKKCVLFGADSVTVSRIALARVVESYRAPPTERRTKCFSPRAMQIKLAQWKKPKCRSNICTSRFIIMPNTEGRRGFPGWP